MKTTYSFLSLKSKPYAKTCITTLFLALILFLFIDIPFWISASVVIFGNLVYLLANIGSVSINTITKQVKIKSIYGSISLVPPLKFTRWWNYDFDESADPNEKAESETASTRANDLHANLHIVDSGGSEVVFTEYIGFDTRFPNECQYSTKTIAPYEFVFRVQRIDKLFNFLQNNLKKKR